MRSQPLPRRVKLCLLLKPLPASSSLQAWHESACCCVGPVRCAALLRQIVGVLAKWCGTLFAGGGAGAAVRIHESKRCFFGLSCPALHLEQPDKPGLKCVVLLGARDGIVSVQV